MEFDEKTHKVKHELLEDREEARAFIDFLEEEKPRHIREAEYSDWCTVMHRNVRRTYDKAMVQLWKSAIKCHQEDIEGIDTLIKEVKERLGL